jgi:membrane-associated phospholipid phosphatase
VSRGTAPRCVHRHHLRLVGLACLFVSVALGIVLRNDYAGTGLDRWFQRRTEPGARRPGQPGFHHRLFFVLTRTTQIGTGRYLVYFAVAACVVVACFAVHDSPRAPWMRIFFIACGPLLALLIAGLSAEELLKELINRRMDGNLGVLTYPSGHAVATASVATSTVVALARVRSARPGPRGLGVVLMALIAVVPLGVGLEMAVLRSHFLTDVIGGWAWGGGWGLIVSRTPAAKVGVVEAQLTPTSR